jgi:hypothetical protein
MALRGFFQRKGDTTDIIGRLGQTTSSLPSGTQEYAVLNNFRADGHDGSSAEISAAIPVLPSDDNLTDRGSYQINQPFGFIGVNQPISFDVEGGGGGGSVTTYYKMRGYYVVGAVYETYVVANNPNTPPPSGHTLIDIAIVSTWQV